MATTLSRMMKKAAASSFVIPLSNRTTPPHRNYTTAIFSHTQLKTSTATICNTSNDATNLFDKVFQRNSIPTQHHFSALAEKRSNTDETLLSAIQSEIERVEYDDLEAPIGFPFKIVVNDGWEEPTIRLTRDCQGKVIEVTVHRPRISGNYLDLDVSVSFQNGLTYFVYQVGVEVQTHDITIKKLSFKDPYALNALQDPYSEADFSDLDDDMQKTFDTSLKHIGIEPSIVKFLHDCLLQRKPKLYSAWLKNVKDFIAVGEKSHKVAEKPEEFPFEIDDSPGEEIMYLTREHQGEHIEVIVRKPNLHGFAEKDKEEVYFDLEVMAYKNCEPFLQARVKAEADRMTIKWLTVWDSSERHQRFDDFLDMKNLDDYQGPPFTYLSENLQKAFLAYLEVREFKPSMTRYLHKYMVKLQRYGYSHVHSWREEFESDEEDSDGEDARISWVRLLMIFFPIIFARIL